MSAESRGPVSQSRSIYPAPSSDELRPGADHLLRTLRPPVATVQLYSAVYSTVQLSHQQHHYILSHRQSVSNSGSSQTLVTKCREILSSPVKNFDIIWLRSVLWPWMTLMKNFICGYLDSDNHHDIVSIFWLRKKYFSAWQKYFLAHTKKTFEMGVQWSRHCETHVPATFWCGVGFHLTQCLSQSDPDTKLWCDEKISGW